MGIAIKSLTVDCVKPETDISRTVHKPSRLSMLYSSVSTLPLMDISSRTKYEAIRIAFSVEPDSEAKTKGLEADSIDSGKKVAQTSEEKLRRMKSVPVYKNKKLRCVIAGTSPIDHERLAKTILTSPSTEKQKTIGDIIEAQRKQGNTDLLDSIIQQILDVRKSAIEANDLRWLRQVVYALQYFPSVTQQEAVLQDYTRFPTLDSSEFQFLKSKGKEAYAIVAAFLSSVNKPEVDNGTRIAIFIYLINSDFKNTKPIIEANMDIRRDVTAAHLAQMAYTIVTAEYEDWLVLLSASDDEATRKHATAQLLKHDYQRHAHLMKNLSVDDKELHLDLLELVAMHEKDAQKQVSYVRGILAASNQANVLLQVVLQKKNYSLVHELLKDDAYIAGICSHFDKLLANVSFTFDEAKDLLSEPLARPPLQTKIVMFFLSSFPKQQALEFLREVLSADTITDKTIDALAMAYPSGVVETLVYLGLTASDINVQQKAWEFRYRNAPFDIEVAKHALTYLPAAQASIAEEILATIEARFSEFPIEKVKSILVLAMNVSEAVATKAIAIANRCGSNLNQIIFDSIDDKHINLGILKAYSPPDASMQVKMMERALRSRNAEAREYAIFWLLDRGYHTLLRMHFATAGPTSKQLISEPAATVLALQLGLASADNVQNQYPAIVDATDHPSTRIRAQALRVMAMAQHQLGIGLIEFLRISKADIEAYLLPRIGRHETTYRKKILNKYAGSVLSPEEMLCLMLGFHEDVKDFVPQVRQALQNGVVNDGDFPFAAMQSILNYYATQTPIIHQLETRGKTASQLRIANAQAVNHEQDKYLQLNNVEHNTDQNHRTLVLYFRNESGPQMDYGAFSASAYALHWYIAHGYSPLFDKIKIVSRTTNQYPQYLHLVAPEIEYDPCRGGDFFKACSIYANTIHYTHGTPIEHKYGSVPILSKSIRIDGNKVPTGYDCIPLCLHHFQKNGEMGRSMQSKLAHEPEHQLSFTGIMDASLRAVTTLEKRLLAEVNMQHTA